jgi:3-deoxy-D-manno-octulosonic-acid transferase
MERTDAPLVWVHAASVGECLAAEPIVQRLRKGAPGIQLVRSFSSPSAASWAASFAGDVHDFIPPDEPKPVRRVLDALEPSLLLFSRGDLWPELVFQSASRGIPIAVAGAAVRPASRRLLLPVRTVCRQLYNTIAWVGAISKADASRWIRLGARSRRVTVTGDPRHDQVLERTPWLQGLTHLIDRCPHGSVIVAGSTHSSDESVVLGAFAAVAEAFSSVRLIVVPHDPRPPRIAQLMREAARHGTAPAVWTGAAPVSTDSSCVVVAATGVLADLYALADVAYVGGGFERGMLHAVIEPAAYAVPVTLGPHYHGSADAELLLASGGAAAVTRNAPTTELARIWLDWLREPERRIAAGLSARGSLQQGAAANTAEALLSLIRP